MRREGGEFDLAEFAIGFNGIAPRSERDGDMFSRRIEPENLFAMRIDRPDVCVARQPHADDVLSFRYTKLLFHGGSLTPLVLKVDDESMDGGDTLPLANDLDREAIG